jgi:hypothetical protein
MGGFLPFATAEVFHPDSQYGMSFVVEDFGDSGFEGCREP